MKVFCRCGHPQVLHMGPTGPCRAILTKTEIDEPELMMAFGGHCACLAFVLEASERERADLG